MRFPLSALLLALGSLAVAGCCAVEHDDAHGRRAVPAAAAHEDDDTDEALEPADDDEDGDGQEIALSAVPANVLAAAQAALPGATFTEAETETEDGVLVYTLEGVEGGVEWEVEVTADGRVLEVEQDD